MARPMVVSAAAVINEDTRITFMTCPSGQTEFTFDKADLILEASEKGLRKLADAVNAAIEELQSMKDDQD